MKAMTFGLMLAAGLLPLAAMAQDMANGEQRFRKCLSCHTIGAEAFHKIGPNLNEVMGVPVATRPNFNYSQSLMAARDDGLVWTRETLGAFLHNPRDLVPGNKMNFAGIKSDDEIADIIAYMATFSPAYVMPSDGFGAAPSGQ